MNKIRKGSVFDHAREENTLRLTPSSRLDYKEGNVKGHGKRTLEVEIKDDPHQQKTKNAPVASSIRAIWGTGSFLLIALLVVAAIVGTFSYNLPIAVLPLAIIGALLLLYLLGVMLIPKRLTERNFVTVLREFLKWALIPTRKR